MLNFFLLLIHRSDLVLYVLVFKISLAAIDLLLKKFLFFVKKKKGYECFVYYLESIEIGNEKGDKKSSGLFINGVCRLGFYLKWLIVSVIKHLRSPYFLKFN